MLNELRNQLDQTQASLSSHVDRVRALEDMLAEHEAIKSEIATLRGQMDERKREVELLQSESNYSRHRNNEYRGDLQGERYVGDDDDSASIHTVVPHELERVDEEDEDQLVNEEEDEDRRRHREEIGRPRTPEPTGMGIDDDESPKAKRRDHSPGSLGPYAASAILDKLAERLSVLSERIDTAVESNNSLQAQHAATHTTIALLQSKISSIEELVQGTQLRIQQQATAHEAAQAEILRAVQEPIRDLERESLTAMLDEWKKSVEGQWSSVQEEWSQERERLNKAREEWENRAKSLELGFDAKVNASVASIIAMQRHHPYANGDIKTNGGGLVTPPSPVSDASHSRPSRSRRRRSSSSPKGSRSSSLVSSIEMIEGVADVTPENGTYTGPGHGSDRCRRNRSQSPSIPDESDPEPTHKAVTSETRYLITPDPSVKDCVGRRPLTSVGAMSETESCSRKADVCCFTIVHLTTLICFLQHQLGLAAGILVFGIATAAVLWRVKQE